MNDYKQMTDGIYQLIMNGTLKFDENGDMIHNDVADDIHFSGNLIRSASTITEKTE